MSAPLTAPLPRRRLLAAGALGLATAASLATIAPARADGGSDGDWDEAFLTRSETREGFVVDDMDDWQVQNAKFLIAAVKGHGLSQDAGTIVLITAIVEAWMYNYEPAVDADSGGLFQQRPSMGWGTYDQVRHKKRAVDAFLGLGDHSSAPGLLQAVPDYEGWDPGDAAQEVQASAHPERYAEQVDAAWTIWDRYADDVEPYTD